MKPVLSLKDKRVVARINTHAALMKRGNEFKWHLLDNLPENWELVGITKIAISGKTISEAVFLYNKAMKNVRIKSRKKPVPESLHSSAGQK
jgi:hypothetical protein